VKHASSDELGSPGLLFFGFNFSNKLGIGILFLLLLKIGDDVDDLERFL